MSFICKPCHDKEQEAKAKSGKPTHEFSSRTLGMLGISRGVYEDCRKVADCVDCKG